MQLVICKICGFISVFEDMGSCVFHNFQGWEMCLICKNIFPDYHGFDFPLVINIYLFLNINKQRLCKIFRFVRKNGF